MRWVFGQKRAVFCEQQGDNSVSVVQGMLEVGEQIPPVVPSRWGWEVPRSFTPMGDCGAPLAALATSLDSPALTPPFNREEQED